MVFDLNHGDALRKDKIISSCIFIDWNNVKKLFMPDVAHSQSVKIQKAIIKIQDQCAFILKSIDSTCTYKVHIRFYDGWHRKENPTSVFKELEKTFATWGLERTIGRIYFSSGAKYGNNLACESLRNPLFSTSRDTGQKMVDTAIVCDFLYMLQGRHIDIGLIASDDDDFIPAALTAEAWGLKGFLIRTSGRGLEEVTNKVMDSPIKYWSLN